MAFGETNTTIKQIKNNLSVEKKQKIFLYKWKVPRDIFVTDTKPVWEQMVLSIRPEITAILRNISVHVQTKIWRVIISNVQDEHLSEVDKKLREVFHN